MYKYRFKNI